MSEHTQMKGAGKSRHLPIGTPGSCLTEDDRDLVRTADDISGPECRRCRVPDLPLRVVHIEFPITTAHPATALDLARTQAADAFGCIEDDAALIVTIGTGTSKNDAPGRFGNEWQFVVNASWDTELVTRCRCSTSHRPAAQEPPSTTC